MKKETRNEKEINKLNEINEVKAFGAEMTGDEIAKVLDILEEMYPDADCELNYGNLFELVVAVVLSAQTTDRSVNKVTPALFNRYPNPEALAHAGEGLAEEKGLDFNELEEGERELLAITEVSEIIHAIGMYKTKSKNIVNLAKALCEKYDGAVPDNYEALIALPGVGRKTANVVLAVGFGQQRIAVDTHVFRVANRIGFCDEKDALKTELALMKCLPESRWSRTHHSLIFLGRYCCDARKPKCEECRISEYCKYFKNKV